MQNILVMLCLFAALLFIGRRAYRGFFRTDTASCDYSCPGCGHSSCPSLSNKNHKKSNNTIVIVETGEKR